MRTALVLAFLSCVGCRVEKAVDQPIESPTTQPVEAEPSQSVAPPNHLAMPALPCSVEFGPEDENTGIAVILVGGQPTPLEYDVYVDHRLVAYAAGEGEVLLAFGSGAPWLPTAGSPAGQTLWRVRCSAPSKPEPALELEGAEFPWSVLAPDHRHIYFTYQGVQKYSIATGKFEPMIRPHKLDDCWEFDGRDSDEFVAGWQLPGELLVLSGGPCEFEAEWTGEMQVVTEFGDPDKPPKRRTREWVGALAAGAGDRVWVGDGGECSIDFHSPNYGTPGLWRSDDAGTNWTFLPLQGITAGIRAIWPSPSDPDRVLAATECCIEIGEDVCQPRGGGNLFLTTDGGTTWKKILDESGGYGIEGLLVDEAKHELTVFGGGKAKVSSDDGRKWNPSSATEAPKHDPRARVEIGGFVLEASEDGVKRRASDAAPYTAEVVFRPSPQQPK
jgi:hypothetical protein